MHHVIVGNHNQGVAGSGGNGTAANSITAQGSGADGGGGSGASLANNLFFSFGDDPLIDDGDEEMFMSSSAGPMEVANDHLGKASSLFFNLIL
jgi:hypothetical protein